MQIGNRFRCYPTVAQQSKLLQWIGCQRFIYNAKVGEARYHRRFALATKWKQAYSRFFAGLGGRPVIQRKTGKQSVWLTRELFAFEPRTCPSSGVVSHTLRIGTKSCPKAPESGGPD